MNSLFQKKVHEVVKKIPRGSVLTYKEVAELAGHPGAYRAVGSVMKKNHNPLIPCHRVVRSDGDTGGYNGSPEKKIRLLRQEGAI